jgi:hypothetical protein
MYSTQLEFETKYNKHNIRSLIKAEVLATAVFTDMFVQCVDSIQHYLDTPAPYASKQKRIDTLSLHSAEDIAIQIFMAVLPIRQHGRVSEPIQGVATSLGLQFFDHQLDAVKTGAELLAVSESCGLFTLLSAFSEEHMHDTAVVRPNYELDDSTLSAIHLTMFMPPMLCEPIPWTSNDEGGHLLSSSSCVLGTLNDIGQHQSLDVLNKLQSIAWTLNETMLQEPELPRKVLDMTNPIDVRKAQQHNDRCLQSAMVYDLMLQEDNQFYFIWKYDKRGRMYSQGYDINLQGSEYKKATIEFSKQELLTGI